LSFDNVVARSIALFAAASVVVNFAIELTRLMIPFLLIEGAWLASM
jgi:hypothetical protein